MIVISAFQAWDTLVFFNIPLCWASPNAWVFRPFRAGEEQINPLKKAKYPTYWLERSISEDSAPPVQ